MGNAVSGVDSGMDSDSDSDSGTGIDSVLEQSGSGRPVQGPGSEKIKIEVRERKFEVRTVNIPYSQLAMIKVLQKEFDYEVKGTIYVDHEYKFVSFEVRTDSSEVYSYGASDWRISFHTHPDKTAQKYGVRYFSPPSVDDVLEVYEHSLQFVPDTTQSGFGELSIIFANEGIYVLQVDRVRFAEFNKDSLPVEALEEILKQTFSEFLVGEIKHGIQSIADGRTITTQQGNPSVSAKGSAKVDFEQPDITIEDFTRVVRKLSGKVSDLYGFNMSFYPWNELKQNGLTLKVSDYFLNKKVVD